MRTIIFALLVTAGVAAGSGCGAFGGSAAYPEKTITIEPHAFVYYEGVSPVTKTGEPGKVTGEVTRLDPDMAAPGVPDGSNLASSAQDATGNSRCFIVVINANDAPAQDSQAETKATAEATVNSPNSRTGDNGDEEPE